MSTPQRIDLFREAFPETFDGKPARLQVFKVGKWQHPTYGEIEVRPDDLDKIIQNYERSERAVAIDYNHGMDVGKTPEEQRAAGWLRNLAKVGDGDGAALWADVDLTEEAYEYVKKGEYRFVSPTWVQNFRNKETGEDQGVTLLRAALTNTPFIDGMHPAVALSERAASLITAQEKEESEKRDAPKREVKAVSKYGRPVLLHEPEKGGLTLKTEVVDV